MARLARLVAFAEDDSTTIDRAGAIDVLSDIAGGRWITGVIDPPIESMTDEAIEGFRQQVRALLRRLVAVSRTWSGPAPTVRFTVAVSAVPLPGVRRGRVTLGLSGAAPDVLWFQIVHLLNRVGVYRLMTCECGRIFAKVGRREYCSVQCQKRVYMRDRRQHEREAAQRARRGLHGKATRKR